MSAIFWSKVGVQVHKWESMWSFWSRELGGQGGLKAPGYPMGLPTGHLGGCGGPGGPPPGGLEYQGVSIKEAM